MELLQDGLVAFFSAVGVTACVWLVAGILPGVGRMRVPGALLVLPVRGGAPAMESDLRELLRLRSQLPGSTVILADCGLDDEARDLAEYLCQRYRGAELRPGGDFCGEAADVPARQNL